MCNRGMRPIQTLMKPNAITVLIADDHNIVRQGLKSLIETDGDIKIVGEARNGEEAVRAVAKLKPNILLLDIAMPVMHGLEAARKIRAHSPDTQFVILSSYSEPGEVDAALDAGVLGYVMKETASSELLKAIREAHRGRAFFSAPVSGRILQRNRDAALRGRAPGDRAPRLTERETQVISLIAKGRANKQIADVLGISIKTVEKHRQALMDKIHIHEAAGLTRYAIESNLVPKKDEPADKPSLAANPA